MFDRPRRAGAGLSRRAALARLSEVCLSGVCFTGVLRGAQDSPPAGRTAVERAMERLYNFDFAAANQILDSAAAADPADPLPHIFRAASVLFQELDRLMILEGEFFADDKRIIEKKKLTPDPALRNAFFQRIEKARECAQVRLKGNGSDTAALFSMSVAAGLVTDYAGLIERRQLGSLQYAKESHSYAVKLLRIDPNFSDAYLTTGLTEYLLGSVPFFVRWFLKFEAAEGSKLQAVENLNRVVTTGRYFGPFAKILLAIIHLREKRPAESLRLLRELQRDFPENPLIRKELEKLSSKMK
jgi:tetratricopeptide (TPR) repeat protein